MLRERQKGSFLLFVVFACVVPVGGDFPGDAVFCVNGCFVVLVNADAFGFIGH